MTARLTLLTLALATGCASCGGAAPSPTDRASAEPPSAPPPLPPRAAEGYRDPARSPLGTNLDSVSDWSGEIPFVDLFRTTRPWNSAASMDDSDDARPVDVDAHLWVRRLPPGQIVRTGMLNGGSIVTRAGRYVVLYAGQGRVEYFGGVERRFVESESRPGRHVFDIDPAEPGVDFFGFAITETDPDDPIRDVHVLLPGGSCEDDERRWCDEASPCASGARCVPFEESYEARPFNPDFLAELDLYGVIRFMNWNATNDSDLSRWEDRPRLEDARWATGRGVPLEVIADLVNRLDADAWICLPHLVDDAYAREAGRLLRRTLEPERRVYLEYSNEVWNGMFEQAQHARRMGQALHLAGEDQVALGSVRFYARRSMEVFAAFDEGFGDRDRVVHVIGAHSGNDFESTEMLAVDGLAEAADALAIAPYFGDFVRPDERAEFMAKSVDALLAEARDVHVPEALRQVRMQRAIAARHGLPLIAYEAGQHYVAVHGLEHDAEVNARMDALNRDPRFEAIYAQYLEGWREAGGGLLAHFVHAARSNDWGRFGALEHTGQPPSEAPKLRAIIRFVDAHPRWW